MIAVDIETMPNLEMVFCLPEPKASGVLKDPDKIKADIAAKRAEQFDKMALSPLYGKIACIGMYGKNGEIEECLMINPDGTGEKEIIQKFLEITKKKMTVTWNGKGFDYDFIFKRAIYYGIATLRDMKWYVDKYKSTYHTDLMTEFCQFGKYEKLDDVAKVFLNSQKLEFDVTSIKDLITTEEGRKQLAAYCMQDVKLTYDLAIKFGYSDDYDVINGSLKDAAEFDNPAEAEQ